MKYIRTKEHLIAKITAEDKNTISYENNFVVGCLWKEDNNFQVADTIEELCDVYVIRLKNREIPIMETPRKGIRPRPSYFNIGECSFEKGYGAIWTEWGLKYVAKMNDKGELELL